MRETSLRMRELLSRGTNGKSGYTPFEGERQVPKDGKDSSSPDSLSASLVVYGLALAVAAVAVALLLVMLGYRERQPAAVLLLAAAAVLGQRSRVQLSTRVSSSITILPMLLGAVLFGPLASMTIGAIAMLGLVRPPYLRWYVYTLTGALNGALTGVVASSSMHLVSSSIGSIVVATAMAAIAAEAVDVTFASITYRIRGNSMGEVARLLGPLAFLAVPVYAPFVALLAVAYREVSPWTLPLFLGPAIAAQRLWSLYQDERRLTEDLGAVNRRLERANISFATALVATLDARDRYTAGHSAAVAIYARDIAGRLELSESEQQLAHLCGLVHDIGKIGLPAGLLEKPGALTLEERRQMQEHSAIGERILAKVEDYAEIAKIVRHHHERMDGMGYPDGISGDDIPLISRIIAVADAYNAMTSDRPYRDAMPSRVARMRLAQGVEGQFDTTVVAAFEAILAGSTEEYRTGTRLDFTLDAQDTYSPEASEEAA
jgi:putative nucleotidyltransferase with HDIG domain